MLWGNRRKKMKKEFEEWKESVQPPKLKMNKRELEEYKTFVRDYIGRLNKIVQVNYDIMERSFYWQIRDIQKADKRITLSIKKITYLNKQLRKIEKAKG